MEPFQPIKQLKYWKDSYDKLWSSVIWDIYVYILNFNFHKILNQGSNTLVLFFLISTLISL